MKNKSFLEKELEKYKDDFVFKKEGTILGITEKICELMDAQKISRADLAKKLGTSRANITKLLNGENNFTLDTLFKISEALNAKLEIDMRHPLFKQISEIYINMPSETKKQDYSFYKESKQYSIVDFEREKMVEKREKSYA